LKVLVVYLKTSPSAVLGHNANIGRVDAGSDECVKVVVPQIPHLVFVGEKGSSKKVKGIFNRKHTYIGTHTKGKKVGIEKGPISSSIHILDGNGENMEDYLWHW
jgi:hypothetical protein